MRSWPLESSPLQEALTPPGQVANNPKPYANSPKPKWSGRKAYYMRQAAITAYLTHETSALLHARPLLRPSMRRCSESASRSDLAYLPPSCIGDPLMAL